MNSPVASAIVPGPVRNWLENLSKGNLGSINVLASEDESFDVLDPGSASLLTSLPVSSDEVVATAVRNARRAFEVGHWRNESPDQRERVLLKLADLVERDFQFLSVVEALDTGKPLEEAKFDIQEVATVLRYYAGWANKVSGQTIATPFELSAMTIKGPVGICAAITPWNYPLPILMYKLAPALAFGNSFVAKPSELAPLSAIYFAQLCEEAGVADGVVNIVLGAGATGSAIARRRLLRRLAEGATGSTVSARAEAAVATSRCSLAHAAQPDARCASTATRSSSARRPRT